MNQGARGQGGTWAGKEMHERAKVLRDEGVIDVIDVDAQDCA